MLIASEAEQIVDAILSSNDMILLVSIRDWKGNILAVKYRESFTKRFFGISNQIGTRYSGSVITSTLSLANEGKESLGEAQAIITIYKDCKVMLLPMPSHEVIVGLALERSIVTEDLRLAYKIETLLAETIK
jgi:hypothetical protein